VESRIGRDAASRCKEGVSLTPSASTLYVDHIFAGGRQQHLFRATCSFDFYVSRFLTVFSTM
jgi:hypothetical protein